eukprot:Skav229124  [mRNA]  locus=scaffold2966:56598:57541:- [translate_table: standard]
MPQPKDITCTTPAGRQLSTNEPKATGGSTLGHPAQGRRLRAPRRERKAMAGDAEAAVFGSRVRGPRSRLRHFS